MRVFDFIAVTASGSIACAVLDPVEGQIVIIEPNGDITAWIRLPEADPFVTNICFGGPDLRTAYVTSGGRGMIYKLGWTEPGLALSFSGFSGS